MRVYRTRATRDVWRFEVRDATVTAGVAPIPSAGDEFDPALLIEFVIEASGGGGTRLMVGATPDAFERLACAMTLVDPRAAEAAFAAARGQSKP